jgi:hypothetical protein
MQTQEKSISNLILRDLGDGLILRRSTAGDAEALAEFNALIHAEPDIVNDGLRLAAWVRDLLTTQHPTFGSGDFTIVEDSRSGQIVSSMNLISQTWSYAGIEFGVGQPELVGTRSEYRNRGLVRAQFDVVHGWSAERGELVQAIMGIPYYYRQFGYEMALNLGGARSGFVPLIPKLKDGETEPYRVRPAHAGDLAFFSDLYGNYCRRSLVSCVWGEAEWRYLLERMSADNINRFELRIVETPTGEPVGCLAHPHFNWNRGWAFPVVFYEIKSGVPWAEVTPSVIRYMQVAGEAQAVRDGQEPFGAFAFALGEKHPVYDVLTTRLPRVRKPYAWYLRVPDLPAFLRRIAPALEKRLEASAYSGHSGELKITFYRSGLRLAIDRGRLATIEPWAPAPQGHSGDVAFPGLTFLQLVFGYRSFEDLGNAFPDCSYDGDDAFGLLSALFPRQFSNVWPIA